MISATLTTSKRTVSVEDTYTRYSNRAGAPLPLIPRRNISNNSRHRHHLASFSEPVIPFTFSKSTSNSPFTSTAPPVPAGVASTLASDPTKRPAITAAAAASPASLLLRGARVCDSDSEDSATSPSDSSQPITLMIAPRARRVRTCKILPFSTEPSTPTPANAAHIVTSNSTRTAGLSIPPVVIVASDASSSPDVTLKLPPAPLSGAPSKLAARRKLSALKSGKLKLDLTSTYARPAASPIVDNGPSQSNPHAPLKLDVEIPASVRTTLGRKRSGEPLKSSLKSSKSSTRVGLDVVMGSGGTAATSKSEPVTPMHSKAVHFDAQLEHVKLFLAEQRPLAVSRDGSPTDTSEAETDFPSFIYGASRAEEDKVRWQYFGIDVVNMPRTTPPGAEVVLEELALAPDRASVRGQVRVANLAFEKWVAVRFTLDEWQTTSEVAARHVESINNGRQDRFAFAIRLNDMLVRIEDKRLILAVRYSVAGREVWDNNGGSNYIVRFVMAKPKADARHCQHLSLHPVQAAGFSQDLSDLKHRLERVAANKGGKDAAWPALTSTGENSNRPYFSTSRYEFDTSMQSPSCHRPGHARANTNPTSVSNILSWESKQRQRPQTMPVQQIRAQDDADVASQSEAPLPYGSPRQRDDDDPLMTVPFFTRGRQLVRSGDWGYPDCADAATGADMRQRTPPGSPAFPVRMASTRSLSFPRTSKDQHRVQAACPPPLLSPSTTSCSSSSSRSSSPLPSPPADTDGHYKRLLNQYCFYTGSDSPSVPHGCIPRSHSDSKVQGLLLPTTSPVTASVSSLPLTSSLDQAATMACSNGHRCTSPDGGGLQVPAAECIT